MAKKYGIVKASCYLGYITQAIIVNMAPLLFACFSDNFGFSYEMLARIVLINFLVQIFSDLISIKLSKIMDLKQMYVLSHIFSAVGLALFGLLPLIFENKYAAMLISTCIYAFGGGIIEVVVNPIIEECSKFESENKSSAAIAILHSFYCIGHILVVLLSTLFIKITGTDHWYLLPLLWMLVPVFNIFLFIGREFPTYNDESQKTSIRSLYKLPVFILAMILMITAGASEQAIAQWASLFAEKGLHISKVLGDILGPMCFAVCMAIVRMICGIRGEKLNTYRVLLFSSILCIISYSMIIFSSNPIISLIGCSVCGISVAFLWPGVVALSSGEIPNGGSALFGSIAFFGDIGCSLGPWIAGFVSDIAKNNFGKFSVPFIPSSLDADQMGLKCGILSAIVFPIIMLISLVVFKIVKRKK